MKILIIICVFLLCGCQPIDQTNPKTKYVVLVNYSGNGVGNIPPSDTIVIESRINPYIFIKNGVPVIEGSDYTTIYATGVRSFKILSKSK